MGGAHSRTGDRPASKPLKRATPTGAPEAVWKIGLPSSGSGDLRPSSLNLDEDPVGLRTWGQSVQVLGWGPVCEASEEVQPLRRDSGPPALQAPQTEGRTKGPANLNSAGEEPAGSWPQERSPSGLRPREGTKRVITSPNLTSLHRGALAATALEEAGGGWRCQKDPRLSERPEERAGLAGDRFQPRQR